MAVNLINSNDIEVTQNGNNIQLNATVNLQNLQADVTNIKNNFKMSTSEFKTNIKNKDNKDIYGQVIEYTNITLGGKYETYNFSNKSIEWYTCFYQRSDGQFEGTFYNTSSDLFRCLLDISGNRIYYKLGSGMSNISKVIVTLYYTKTS